MVSDQEIAKAVESLLRQTELQNSVTSVNDVVHQLSEKLGFDLSHKTDFIRDQINLVLRSHTQHPPPQQQQQQPQQQQQQPQPPHHHYHHQLHAHNPPPLPQKDHFALHSHPQPQQYPQQFPPHFALHPYHHPHHHPHSAAPPAQPFPPQVHAHIQGVHVAALLPPVPVSLPKSEPFSHNASSTVTSPTPKESAPTGTKRRGGPGGLNKVCGVSPELQAIVGEPALPRTEIVKQLWLYIRKNNLQDPSNKRKIICDDALRVVFETDCTDMFKMNKLLAKHIIALEPTKASSQAKRAKVEAEPAAPESNDDSASSVVISEALAKFFGTGGRREMIKAEAIRGVWEYVRANHLEDPLNSMVILCDAKLRELLGVDSISALGISEIVTHKHLFQRA